MSRPHWRWRWLAAVALPLLIGTARAQESEPAPQPIQDDFESDADGDSIPDGWYNLRDAEWVDGGPLHHKGRCFRIANQLPGRPARASRAFPIDGRQAEALTVGLWIKLDGIQAGERLGEMPSLMLDLLGDDIKRVGRRMLGPWNTRDCGNGWIHVARRFSIPPETREGILTVGLLGATGTLELDELSLEFTPVGGEEVTNLISNGDFELGDPTPIGWILEGSARATSPGYRSSSSVDLARAGARASVACGGPLDRIASVNVSLMARGSGLRGSGGLVTAFFVDGQGEPVAAGVRLFHMVGSFDWRHERLTAPLAIPADARQLIIQIDKPDGLGSLRIDDLQVTAATDPNRGRWTPGHVEPPSRSWRKYPPAAGIEAGSALDFSFLLKATAARFDRLSIRSGKLVDESGQPRRLLGVGLAAVLACPEPAWADAIAVRLARSGVNLVRIGNLDAPLGPSQSLIDDARDDTQALDPEALARFDHLITALKGQGIRVALEFQAYRRFRAGDGVADAPILPPGGGAAAAFDPTIRDRAVQFMGSLLKHRNPETGLSLLEDPVVAWVTLAGELSLQDQAEVPLTPAYQEGLRTAMKGSKLGGRKGWSALEEAQWLAERQALRDLGLTAPVAGSSHWRRDVDFNAAQDELDLIDDRLYWNPPAWGGPGIRSQVWDRRELAAEANKKRRPDRPYVVGQFAGHTRGAWALPYEGADFLAVAATAREQDWDGLVRRILYRYPEPWGNAAPGTTGGDDVIQIPEVLNANPQFFAILPHVSSLLIRDRRLSGDQANGEAGPGASPPGAVRRESNDGRLAIKSPWTQGVGGWVGGKSASLPDVTFQVLGDYAVLLASSTDDEPIARTDRLLVTGLGRCEPTGLRYVDERRWEIADPGRAPLLFQPIRGRVLWKRSGVTRARAFALDNSGKRAEEVAVHVDHDGITLDLDGDHDAIHWELVVDESTTDPRD